MLIIVRFIYEQLGKKCTLKALPMCTELLKTHLSAVDCCGWQAKVNETVFRIADPFAYNSTGIIRMGLLFAQYIPVLCLLQCAAMVVSCIFLHYFIPLATRTTPFN
jgi:hypothetical protein